MKIFKFGVLNFKFIDFFVCTNKEHALIYFSGSTSHVYLSAIIQEKTAEQWSCIFCSLWKISITWLYLTMADKG